MIAKGSESDPAFRISCQNWASHIRPLGWNPYAANLLVREGTFTGGGQHAINAAGHTQQGIFPTLARV